MRPVGGHPSPELKAEICIQNLSSTCNTQMGNFRQSNAPFLASLLKRGGSGFKIYIRFIRHMWRFDSLIAPSSSPVEQYHF